MNVQGSVAAAATVAVITATAIETVASTAIFTTTAIAAVNAALTSSNPPWKLRSVPCP